MPAGKQVQRVRELKEEYAGGRRKTSAPAKSKKSAGSSGAAATKKKRVDTKEGPDEADTDAKRSSTAPTEDVEDDAYDAEAGADSPSIVPTGDGLDLPPDLRRTDGEKQYEDFKARWAQYCKAGFAALPAAMQSKFASELLAEAVIATGKGQGAR